MSNIITDALTARRLEWIRALESGTYAQCTNVIVWIPGNDPDRMNEASYCCLGVGRDVIEPGYFSTDEWLDSDSDGNYRTVRENFGISKRVMNRLIVMNDMRRRNFPFIARFLRKVWGLTGA